MKLYVLISVWLLLHRSLCSAEAERVADSEMEDVQAAGIDRQLNDLLAWSIENSNVSELQRQAQAAERLQEAKGLQERRAEIQAMIVEMDKEPSERQLMEEALSLAKNTTIPKGARIDALTALRYLVEPIDNAMDLPKLGGIELIDRILREETHEGLVAAAAFALGTAASNNPTVQAAALSELSLMRGLLQHAVPGSGQASEKSLYAISALISSSHEGQQQFYQNKGVLVVENLLQSDLSARQLRKVLNLITDLTEVEGQPQGQEAFASEQVLRRLLALMRHPDHDIQERALLGLVSLASKPQAKKHLSSQEARKAIHKSRQHCQDLLVDADADFRDILDNLIVLTGDLEDIVKHPSSDKSEL